MLRFLKKRWKKYRKSETPTRTATGTACGGDPNGEYLPGETPKPDEIDGTYEAIATGINHGGGSQIATQDTKTRDQQVPALNASTLTPGHDSGECTQLLLGLCSFPSR